MNNKKRLNRSSQPKDNKKTKNMKNGIIILIGLSVVLFICFISFINYRFLYKQAQIASHIVINGSIDDDSAKYIRGHRTMSILRLSIDGNYYEISSSWYNSYTYSIDELLNILNSGNSARITYISLRRNVFSQETKNEIIGLRIENTDYLTVEKGLNKLIETYKLSKNLTLIASIFLILLIIFVAWVFL